MHASRIENDTMGVGAAADPLRYDARSVRLHWLTAILVVVLWCLGQTIDWFPTQFRVSARSVHIVLGVVLALALCYRLWWRTGAGRRLPPAGTGATQVLAAVIHVLLYVGLLTVVVLGITNTWVRGDNIFNLFTLPSIAPGNKVLRHQVEDMHGLAANILLALAGLHALAGLVHHYVLKDDVLRRMR